MTRHIHILCYALFILLLHGCAEEPFNPTPEDNSELLFPTAKPLMVSQVADAGEINFQIGNLNAAYLSIAIYTEPPSLIDGSVFTTSPPVWEYRQAVMSAQSIALSDGTLRADIAALDNNYFLCAENQLYWVAWAWDETAQFVTHSSLTINPLQTLSLQPELSLLSALKLGAGPNDTFLRAGSEIELQLLIENSGDLLAESVSLTLRQNEVPELPITDELENIPVGAAVAKTVVFTLPPDGSFGEEYQFELSLSYNDCIQVTQTFTLRINDVRVAITDVRLKKILFIPPGIFWDFGLPIQFDPDIYYIIFSPTQALDTSDVLDNATDDFPITICLGDWSDLAPALNLAIDSTYSVQFWDEDISDDDFIGDINFRPLDYIATRPSVIFDTTDRVIAEVYLSWE